MHSLDEQTRILTHTRGTKIFLPKNDCSLDHLLIPFIKEVSLTPLNTTLRTRYEGRTATLTPISLPEEYDKIIRQIKKSGSRWFCQQDEETYLFSRPEKGYVKLLRQPQTMPFSIVQQNY